MSKSKKVKYDMTPYINYLNYLNNYDTSNVDNTLSNLTNWASNSSAQNLSNMGNYTFNVDASDEARQRAEDAVYNSYVDKLTPQFETQTSNLSTSLQNKGIPVGSEAYIRAMNNLQDNQNEALNQAAYNSVLAGQNAYSQSLADEISAGSFGNSAQQAYINQLLSALSRSVSGYENQQNIFGVGTGLSNLQYQQDLANAQSKGGLGSSLGGLVGAGIGGYLGGFGGASLGSSIGSGIGGYFG